MSREQLEAEIAEFIEGALNEVEAKINAKYPGAFDSFSSIDSPVGATSETHQRLRSGYAAALAAGIRWSIWINE
jgi:hypothetical protein